MSCVGFFFLGVYGQKILGHLFMYQPGPQGTPIFGWGSLQYSVDPRFFQHLKAMELDDVTNKTEDPTKRPEVRNGPWIP